MKSFDNDMFRFFLTKQRSAIMNLRIRITSGFLLIVMVMTVVAGVIIWQQAKMQSAFQDSILTSELDHYLLECRRQEKNYLLRQDGEALVLFQANYDTLFTMATNLSNKILYDQIVIKLSVLQDKLILYRSAFEQSTLYLDVESYKTQYNESIRTCVMFARESHSIIKDIRQLSEERFEKALSISSIVNTFSVIVGIFLSVVISGFIADKVMDLIGSPEREVIE